LIPRTTICWPGHDADRRAYAAARGQLDLALGTPMLPIDASRGILMEKPKRKVGAGNIIFAQQNRDLYAVLAGVWLAQAALSGCLALWERYRLRISASRCLSARKRDGLP